MSKYIKKIILFTIALALFMGNIAPPANNNLYKNYSDTHQVSNELDSSWSLGFNKSYASRYSVLPDCPANECIIITPQYDPNPSIGDIDWGDYGSGGDVGGNNGFYYGYANMQDSYVKKYAKDACYNMADRAAINCKKEVAVMGVVGGLVCIAGGIIFTISTGPGGPALGTACSVVVAGATTYDMLTCDLDLLDDKAVCKSLP